MGPSTSRVWSRNPRQKGVWQPYSWSSIKICQWRSHQERKEEQRGIPRWDTKYDLFSIQGITYNKGKITVLKNILEFPSKLR